MSKVALVTGNHRGLGKAISERLIELGYHKPLEIRSAEYDLTKPEACKRLIDHVIEKYGRLDLLVNNLGNYKKGYIDACSCDDWHEMLDSNLNSAFYLSKLSLEHLRANKGKVINIGLSGIAKLSPPPELLAYQVAKTGILVLTKAMAKVEAEHGVTVNMISPGSMENTVEDESMIKRIPMRRFAKLDEVVGALEYFLANDYITGQNIEVAGGRGL